MSWRVYIIIAACFLLYCSGGLAAAIMEVSPQVAVFNIEYSFYDLLTPQSQTEGAALKEIILNKAPAEGQTHFYSQLYLKHLLTRQGFCSDNFMIPDQVEVKSNLKIIESAQVKASIIELLLAVNEDLIISFPQALADLAVPQGELKFSLAHNQLRIPATNFLLIEVTIDNQRWCQLNVRVYLDQLVTVYQAQADLKRNQELKAADFLVVELTASALPPNPLYYDSDYDFSDYIIRTDLKKGSVLAHHQLMIKPLINRGDLVTLTLRQNGIELAIKAQALASGGSGDYIRVLILSTNQVLSATIINKDAVLINKN